MRVVSTSASDLAWLQQDIVEAALDAFLTANQT